MKNQNLNITIISNTENVESTVQDLNEKTIDKNVNSINNLMIKIKSDYESDNLNPNELYTLATVIVLAELKNTIDPNRYKTTNKTGKSITKPTGVFPLFLYNLKNTVMGQLKQLTKKYDDGKTIEDYISLNRKGDIVINQAKLNADMNKLYYTLHNGCSNDASDLIQSTVLYLLEELEYMKTNNIDSFETVRQAKVPNKKIYIKVEDSVNYWKNIDICGIQCVYKKLRSEINGQKTVKEAINNNYCYFQYDDDDIDDNKEIYIRVPMYSTLISSDAYGLNTVSQCDYERLNTLISDLKLSAREKAVLNAKLTHSINNLNGHKSIATYLGFTDSNVKVCISRIKEKFFKYIDECEMDEYNNPILDEFGMRKYKHKSIRNLYFKTI